MKKNSLDYWVGLFVVVGFAALLFLALKAGNMSSLSFQDTYAVTAQFDNIGGLKPRAPVKSAGVVVGRVASINFDDKQYQATVTMNLDKRYEFPRDTSAKILTSGLLGEQYIGLEAGGDDKMLAQGSKITMTQSAVVLENLIGQFLYNKAADAGAGGGNSGNGNASAPAPSPSPSSSNASGSGAAALPAAPGMGGSK
ncbi:phospholipid/cholesterol/gamma-HCH transport system substrate-binding protein [Ralstonia sp. 25mfcol4.1]|uniref:outer membrane lipid asymmetry maintenance protein MlaD n=1 Tax=Burkholderiaceae TaxID=119060 RepID=UPI00088A1C31|nr:outer membrane lipid asymmetry maintenance protein MlaD [Ralstonia sp. 25mfcol4.1]SDP63922.1 phospholipid/cholesterol/gamma-HCH transport system substrate-binding protein [Ralstonia sp. 25mfcol4.1]